MTREPNIKRLTREEAIEALVQKRINWVQEAPSYDDQATELDSLFRDGFVGYAKMGNHDLATAWWEIFKDYDIESETWEDVVVMG